MASTTSDTTGLSAAERRQRRKERILGAADARVEKLVPGSIRASVEKTHQPDIDDGYNIPTSPEDLSPAERRQPFVVEFNYPDGYNIPTSPLSPGERRRPFSVQFDYVDGRLVKVFDGSINASVEKTHQPDIDDGCNVPTSPEDLAAAERRQRRKERIVGAADARLEKLFPGSIRASVEKPHQPDIDDGNNIPTLTKDERRQRRIDRIVAAAEAHFEKVFPGSTRASVEKTHQPDIDDGNNSPTSSEDSSAAERRQKRKAERRQRRKEKILGAADARLEKLVPGSISESVEKTHQPDIDDGYNVPTLPEDITPDESSPEQIYDLPENSMGLSAAERRQTSKERIVGAADAGLEKLLPGSISASVEMTHRPDIDDGYNIPTSTEDITPEEESSPEQIYDLPEKVVDSTLVEQMNSNRVQICVAIGVIFRILYLFQVIQSILPLWIPLSVVYHSYLLYHLLLLASEKFSIPGYLINMLHAGRMNDKVYTIWSFSSDAMIMAFGFLTSHIVISAINHIVLAFI